MAEQGLFCPAFFFFFEEMVTSEKRGKDTAKEDRILCLCVSDGIYHSIPACSLSLAPVPQLLSSDSSWIAPVAGCDLPLPFVVHQQLSVQLLMAL